MPLHAIEFVLSADDDARVREIWAALVDADLPSQARHQGPTNAPHLTVAAALQIDETSEQVAIDAAGPLLPAQFEVTGVDLLGRGAPAVVLTVSPPERLRQAVDAVREALDQEGPWVPHLTLARRVRETQVDQVTGLLSTLDLPEGLTVSGLRRWDPESRSVRALVDTDVCGAMPRERTSSCADASR